MNTLRKNNDDMYNGDLYSDDRYFSYAQHSLSNLSCMNLLSYNRRLHSKQIIAQFKTYERISVHSETLDNVLRAISLVKPAQNAHTSPSVADEKIHVATYQTCRRAQK